MPSIVYNQIISIINDTPLKNESFNIFVETGTHAGYTVKNMIPYFNKIHTIELSEEFYNDAVNKFKNNDNVILYLGDSAKVLPTLIDKLGGNTIFFLDGHWSGGDTAQGDKDCPLVEELVAINKFKHKSIIIIDDYRLFGTNYNEDWSLITDENIKKPIQERIIYTTVNNDRLILVIE